MAADQPWERIRHAWQHVFFGVALALAGANAVPEAGRGAGQIALRIGVLAALAGWYGFWFIWRDDPEPAHRVYLVGVAVLWAGMSAVDPELVTVGVAVLIPYGLRHPVWAGVAIGVLAAAWGVSRAITGDMPSPVALLACALGVTAAVGVLGYIATLDRERHRRQQLIDELSAAQARLAAAERRAGVLAERQRLARDIHDTLTQGFASIALNLDATTDDLPPGGPARAGVDRALRTARENLAESRRLIAALRPVELSGRTFPDALRRLTERIADERRLTARSVLTGEPVPLDDSVEIQLLRAVQEALTNVRRHSGATEVTVTLSYLDGLVLVDVRDNGTGIDLDGNSSGVGLVGMRERLGVIGGTLTVESALGEGTTVAMAVPVRTDNSP